MWEASTWECSCRHIVAPVHDSTDGFVPQSLNSCKKLFNLIKRFSGVTNRAAVCDRDLLELELGGLPSVNYLC